jgi:RNA polymerase sigma factor (sigma-70 family)
MMASVDIGVEYERHLAALVHYATVLVGPDDAMDVVNEAVTSTLARQSLDNVDNVQAYWLGAISKTAAGWHRSGNRRRIREQRASAHSTEPPHTPPSLDAQRALSNLSVQQRAVVYLTYWHDWEPSRVAASLGVSEGAVRKQLGRARQRLRKELTHG